MAFCHKLLASFGNDFVVEAVEIAFAGLEHRAVCRFWTFEQGFEVSHHFFLRSEFGSSRRRGVVFLRVGSNFNSSCWRFSDVVCDVFRGSYLELRIYLFTHLRECRLVVERCESKNSIARWI